VRVLTAPVRRRAIPATAVGGGGSTGAYGDGTYGAGTYGGGVGGAVPVNTVAPVVTPSSANVGDALSTTTGSWTNTPTSYTYQWQRAGVDIAAATASTYTTVTADSGLAVLCNVTAVNAAGSSTTAASNAITVAAGGGGSTYGASTYGAGTYGGSSGGTPTGLVRPARGVFAVGAADPWGQTGLSASTWANRLEWATFHAPETGTDENFRIAMEAATQTVQPPFDSFEYCEFGYAVNNATWTTGMNLVDAGPWLANFGGSTWTDGTITAINMASTASGGWGVAIAQKIIARINALPNGSSVNGVTFDDINVYDGRLPTNNGVAGTPDGYTTATYAAGIKVQLQAATDYLNVRGYKTFGNVSITYVPDVTTGPQGFPATPASLPGTVDDLIGVCDYTNIEHSMANKSDGSPWLGVAGRALVQRVVNAASLAASRGKVINLNNYITMSNTTFNDYLPRIIGTPGYVSASYGTSEGNTTTLPWVAGFLTDYGTPTGPLVSAPPVLSRPFPGITLNVNTDLLTAYTS
jgi:hypothetical protein